MASAVRLTGSVISGRGRATAKLQAVEAEIRDVTGNPLAPGSLNVVLAGPVCLRNAQARVVDDGRRLLWPATLGGEPVWIYRWRTASLHVIEVLSRDHLRTMHRLRDGDIVTLDIAATHVRPLRLHERLGWSVVWSCGRQRWAYTSDWYLKRVGRKLNRRFGVTQRRCGSRVE